MHSMLEKGSMEDAIQKHKSRKLKETVICPPTCTGKWASSYSACLYVQLDTQNSATSLFEMDIIYVLSNFKFQKQHGRLKCRVNKFNPPHQQGVSGQALLSIGSLANQRGDMCVQMMTMMKLNYDQRVDQCIILLFYMPIIIL